jgi:hypothetical protein
MTFDEMLDQVITLLKRQGRVSYGALKRRFALDDAYLEDLKIELVEAQRLAVDENGRILVWRDDTNTLQEVASPPPQKPQPPTAQETPPTHASPLEFRPREAERRQDRESEVTLLLERWEQAKDGQGQVILSSGEAGIGKSRLVQVLKDHLADLPHARWECRSSPYYKILRCTPLSISSNVLCGGTRTRHLTRDWQNSNANRASIGFR